MKTHTFASQALRISFACLASSAYLPLATAGPRILAQNVPENPAIHFRLVHNTLIVISLFADRSGPIDFVLDTGADTTVVDPSILPRLSFVPLDRIPQTTLSGVQMTPRGLIKNLSLGPMQIDDVPVLVQDLTELHKMDPHIEGIVGQSFLTHFNYLIDYREHLLRIERDREIQNEMNGEHVAIQAAENRMFVVADAHAFGRAKLSLMLDSGADTIVLLHPASQALRIPAQETTLESKAVLESTSSGHVRLNSGIIYDLTVGSRRLRNLLAVLPTVDPREHIGDGMLPTALFQTIYINNQERFAVFDPGIGN
jgi:predicted aspartyl protease